MKEYLLSFWNKFKNGTAKFKILICSLIILYIGVLCVCFIQFEVDSTLPGTVTNVSDVIKIDSENENGKIYTVSVYSHPKMSLLQYWLVKLDKNSDVSKGKSLNLEIFTENEEYASNVGYKEQSIQDSLIVAYKEAILNGYDVFLDYSYKGQNLINIPQNLFKTGSEDFKNSDVVVGYNDVLFTSEEDYLNALDTIFDGLSYEGKTLKQYKDENTFVFYDNNGNVINNNVQMTANLLNYVTTLQSKYNFKIIRNNEEKTITPSVKMLFYLYSNILSKNSSLYTITETYYTKYTINYDKCNPKIKISESNTVGPSGGLMQTLAIYNSITNDDITKGKFILGTGGINLSGKATLIGGEQQKVVTAHLYEADIFFIPSGNYESAKEKYDTLKDTKLVLVPVESFNDVINYLNNMEVNNG